MPVKRWCFVPECTNTSNKTPLKMFFPVPVALKRREQWFAAAKRNVKEVSLASAIYCCEDHFDLEKDMENYMEFKLSNVRARMKRDAVPHKFVCQCDKILMLIKPRQLSEKTAREKEISEYLYESKGPSTTGQVQDLSEPSTSLTFELTCEKACQTKPVHFRKASKAVHQENHYNLKMDDEFSSATIET